MIVTVQTRLRRFAIAVFLLSLVGSVGWASRTLTAAQIEQPPAAAREVGGGEASLVLPDLSSVDFRGVNGRSLLMGGLIV